MQLRASLFGAAALAFLSGACDRQEAKLAQISRGVYAREPLPARKFVRPNQGFVVMSDRVVVIDPGFPAQARELLAQIRTVTDKPVRSVFVTHAHGDHLDGAFVFADLGAEIIGARAGQDEYEGPARRRFLGAQNHGMAGYENAHFAPPTRYFDDLLVIEDASQRLELRHFGHGHTPGDAVAWLPRAGVLFTGDVCDNGPYSTLGQGNSSGWIAVLDRLLLLDPEHVVPGHGPVADARVLQLQRRYLVELRASVQTGIGQGRSAAQIAAELDMPFYLQWTGKRANTRIKDVENVFVELGGQLPPRKPPLLSKRRGMALGLLALLVASAARGFVVWRRRRSLRSES